MRNFRDVRREENAQKRIVFRQRLRAENCDCSAFYGNRRKIIRRQNRNRFAAAIRAEQSAHPLRSCNRFRFPCFFGLSKLLLRRQKMVFRNQLHKFKLTEKLVKRIVVRFADGVILRRKVNRCVAADRCKIV